MITAFTSIHSGGGTFLDWSYQYLKGNQNFWQYQKGWLDLPDNPLTRKNAHGYLKNHPGEYHLWHEFVEQARREDSGEDVSFYPVSDDVIDPSKWVDNVNMLAQAGVRVVVIKKTLEYPYSSERTPRTDQHDMECFISENPAIDGTLSRSKLRELASLRVLSTQTTWLGKIAVAFSELHEDVIMITDVDYLNRTEWCITKIFDGLGHEINQQRLALWRPIMQKWNENNKAGFKFYDDLPRIANAIVTGTDMDLSQYDLKFFQEAVIMAHLIKSKKCRLVIPSDDFPKNAKKLHQFIKNHKI